MGRALLLRARRLDCLLSDRAPGQSFLTPRGEEMAQMMREPQEIDDEEYEQVLARVAAIDVAKASGMVCTRVPHPSRPGKRRTLVWEAGADTGAIIELGAQLAAEGIEKVTLEATSEYWRPFFYLLEA